MRGWYLRFFHGDALTMACWVIFRVVRKPLESDHALRVRATTTRRS